MLRRLKELLAPSLPEEVREQLRRDAHVNSAGFDPWGLNVETAERAMMSARWIYERYFRVRTHDIERVPAGRVMLVGNHGGQLPFDGFFLAMSMVLEAKPPRIVRGMVERGSALGVRALVDHEPDRVQDGGPLAPDLYELDLQAWSLVRFLRTGGAHVEGWDERYGALLDEYFAALLETRDPDLARQRAFADVDWEALDRSWRRSTRSPASSPSPGACTAGRSAGSTPTGWKASSTSPSGPSGSRTAS